PATARRHRRPSFVALVLLLAVAAPAAAQYRDAGEGLELLPNRKEQLEKALDDAPWTFGKLRVAPWIGLRNVNYVRELDAQGREQEGDLTATAGAGLRAYLKLGTHAIAAAHAIPEYSWWQKQDDRNARVGRYGLGLFGWFNRVEGEVTTRRIEEVRFLSSDVLVHEPTRDDVLNASAQVRVLGSIAVFGSASADRTRIEATSGLTPNDPAQLLDRDGTVVRGGLRYLLRGRRGYVGAGVLIERTEFQGAADATRSNEGSSWYTELQLEGNHLTVGVQYDQHDLEGDDSTFPGYEAAGGRATVLLHPGWRIQYQLYGSRQLRYSALAAGSFIEEERAGAGAHVTLGKGGLQLFYESGSDDYFGSTTRQDDVTAMGAWIDLPVRRLNLRVGGRQTEFETAGGAKREVREVLGTLSLAFGGPGDW
ncbi:MAG TPA: hypothetical protein VN923_10090, partial [Thermoanaerobaculia bacterium]|nr:hypothetical protein [Thermoanaerobaculia bacterium]